MLNDSLDEAGELFAAPDSEATEAGYDIAKLLEQLPDRQRLPIQYVKIEGASVADAAARTGMSVSAVKVGIHRGLKTLAAKIGVTVEAEELISVLASDVEAVDATRIRRRFKSTSVGRNPLWPSPSAACDSHRSDLHKFAGEWK